MAFMGRGGGSSINIGNKIDNSNNNNGNTNLFRHLYFFGRYRFYIPLDNAYVATLIILTLIIFIVAIITFFAIYKPTIIDPIESTKKLFINTQLIGIVVLLVTNFITNITSKKESVLIKRLLIVFIISIITMLIFGGIKIDLDKTYTKDKFEQIYSEQNIEEDEDDKSKISIGADGIKLKDSKEYYVDKCMEAYNIFNIRTYGTFGLHFLLNILIIYQIVRLSRIHSKKITMNKDDLILFDEEQNIRY